MTETLLQGSDWLTWIENTEHDKPLASEVAAPIPGGDGGAEPWDKTDRPFQFRAKNPAPAGEFSKSDSLDEQSSRARWLQAHNVETYFLDGGIGCCWFAEVGDGEPVCGETEDAAIERLARACGFDELPRYRI